MAISQGNDSPTVILLGASVRAAADSAARAGWTTWCADLFADRDLRLRADVRAISSERYPHALLDQLELAPPGPVVYTGALENYPNLIAKIHRSLWGNSADVLRAVRDPWQWTAALATAGLPYPRIEREPQSMGRWLLKPLRSGAGIGIVSYHQQVIDPRTHFLQERIEGTPISALCIGTGSSAILVGVTEQLIGTPWLNAAGFYYAGNLGPIPLSPSDRNRWQTLANLLANRFRLRGLFGIDAILHDGIPWPIEINPRYTAAVEIHERASHLALLDWHRQAFDDAAMPTWQPAEPSVCHGKAVLYARETFSFPHDGPWMESLRKGVNVNDVAFADIPDAGAQILAGQPVLTLFASAATPSECSANLEEIASALARRLWG